MYRSTIKFMLLVSLCSLLMGGNAMAERQAGAFTLSPMVGYQVIDGGMDLDDAAVFGLGVGYNITSHWAIEADLRYAPTETSSSNSIDVDIWTIGLGGIYHFMPKADLNPYLSFGGGLMVYDIDGTSSQDEDVFGYYGGGIKYALCDSTDFRLDARHILDYRSDNRGSNHDDTDWRHHLQAMAGVTYQFGSAPAAAKQESALVPMAEEETDPLADSDHDGVPDLQDKCSGTAPGVRVDNVGCPADTDADGVVDYKDACIDTPKGTEVDQHGCPAGVEEVASLTLNIMFGFDKDQVTPFHSDELKKAAEFVRKYPMYKVVVEGHTDDQGAAEYNQSLSQRRADNVQKALIDKYGVAANRISAVGFGETQPLTMNTTDEERVKNRRVEISIRP